MSVGMTVDIGLTVEKAGLVIGLALGLVVLKASLLSGLGLAASSLAGRRGVVEAVAEMRRVLDEGAAGLRAERLPGPFLWYF